MKCLSNFKTEVKGNKVFIEADILEQTFGVRVQQVTVGYYNQKNLAWPRHCQLSHEALFIKAFGNGVGVKLEDLVALAAAVEPKTTFPPKMDNKLDSTLKVELSSELTPTLQWQVSEHIDNRADWKDIDGATDITFDKSKVETGHFVRVIARSDAGEMISNAAIVS